MLKVILAVFAASMSLAMLACTGAATDPASANQEGRPDLIMGVEDLPCGQAAEDVRRALENDTRLGLSKDEKTPDGWFFHTPFKDQFLGNALQWSARVRVRCLGLTSSNISVLVSLANQEPAAEAETVEMKNRIVKYVLARLLERMRLAKEKP